VGLLMWGVLSDERTGLSFAVAALLCQRSHSRVQVPWDSQPYFTVSDSRLPFLSPPTTCRVTVEVFDPSFTRDLVRSVCYNKQPDDIEDTISNPSVSCFWMQLLLAYSLLWKSHCFAKRFTQPLSSDRRYWFIPLPRKWLLRIESIIPLPLKYMFWL
jgi:hypothetical protein